MTKNVLITGTVSSIVILGLWSLAARKLASPFILPAPASVFFDSIVLMKSNSFLRMLQATCLRGFFSFSISLVCALFFGLAGAISPLFTAAIRPWMTIIKATPVVSFILIALLWFGSSTVPIFVSILMTLPIMTEAITKGIRNTDKKLLEMAQIYHFKCKDSLLHIYLPSAWPYFLGGAGASLGLTWKVVVAGEILSSPRFGIGSALQSAKVQLETPRVFSLTLTAIALSIITELFFNLLIRFSTRNHPREGTLR